MEKSRYSMRLRTRESTSSNNVREVNGNGNDAPTRRSAASGRTVFADVSNRRSSNNNNKTKDEKHKSKTNKPEAAAAANRSVSNTRRVPTWRGKKGKEETTKTRQTEPENKLHDRGVSAQGRGEDNKLKNTQLRGRSRLKRLSEVNDDQPVARGSKRAKTEETTTGPLTTRNSTRTCSSLSQNEKSIAQSKSPGEQETVVRENPVNIVSEESRIVPLEFRLQRDSFDGQNYTYGIAHYDAADRSDPLLCKDYVNDMFQYLYWVETSTKPERYMEQQDDINGKMRAILVDWLVEVHMKFRLVPDTLYLCVNIIDRYCSKVIVQRSKLQLIGVTALLVACKHEEIYPPEVRDCVYITDRAYDRQEVLDMEQSILRELDWKISVPTAFPFLHRFLSLVKATPLTQHAASYYLERTLQEHDLLEFRPSLVCAAAVVLALNNPDIRVHEEDFDRKLPGLPKILMEYTEFDSDELVYVAGVIATKVSEEPITASRRQLVAVKRKYEHKKYLSVASEVELPSIRYILEHLPPKYA